MLRSELLWQLFVGADLRRDDVYVLWLLRRAAAEQREYNTVLERLQDRREQVQQKLPERSIGLRPIKVTVASTFATSPTESELLRCPQLLILALVVSVTACGEVVTEGPAQGVGGSSTSSQAGGAGGWAPCEGPERWEPLSGEPSLADVHDGSVWTGSELILWGGYYAGDVSKANTGLRYSPATDNWTPLVGSDPPRRREQPSAAWASSRLVIWGGVTPADGAIYDPSGDSWSPMADFAVPSHATAVSTTTDVLYWGISEVQPYPMMGGIFDPIANSWAPMSQLGAPSQRSAHNAVWTGRVMIVWGGALNEQLNTGGVYDPETDSWSPTSLVGAPSPRLDPAVVWTDEGMFVWGGKDDPNGYAVTGGIYDPDIDSWRATETEGAPTGRRVTKALWTGFRVIVFAGIEEPNQLGGLYDPAADSWTPMRPAPDYSPWHAAWDGCRAITVGGADGEVQAWAYQPPPR